MARPFEGIFGNTCELRLLEFMLPLVDLDFNISELSGEAGVSRTTVGKVVKKFVEWGILDVKNEGVMRYSINNASPIVQTIEVMNNVIIERMLGEEQVREIHDYIHGCSSETSLKSIDSLSEDVWGGSFFGKQTLNLWGAGGCCAEIGLMYASPMDASADGEYENEHPISA